VDSVLVPAAGPEGHARCQRGASACQRRASAPADRLS
jgi:hypothetical protein